MEEVSGGVRDVRARVTYSGSDPDFDDRLRRAMAELGLEEYASGRDLTTGVRDLMFEWRPHD